MVLLTPLIAFGQWNMTKATTLGSQMNAELSSKVEHIVFDSISKMKTIRAESLRCLFAEQYRPGFKRSLGP